MASSLRSYIRAYRKQSQLSQRELAFLLGMTSQGGVSQHESLARLPQLKVLIKYEVLFGRGAAELYPQLCAKTTRDLGKRLKLLILKLERQTPSAAVRRKVEFLVELQRRFSKSR